MRPIIALIALIALTALTGCGAPPTRTGQPVDPVTLTSVTPGGVGGDVISELSSGTQDEAVRVAPPAAAQNGPDEDDDYEGNILAAVAKGTYDVSAVRADILASAGATSLAVLQTPWLVQSEDQAARVAADPVADDLMADLDKIGLVGLALVPGGLRHPIGYGKAILGPEDYAGQGLNTRHGDGMAAIATALGAHVDHSAGEVRLDRIKSGALGLIETSLQAGAADPPAVVTSNVVLITKFDVVFVRKAAWDGLTEGQQAALRTAAVAAGRRAVAARQDERTALAAWCAGGATASVVATPAEVAELHAKLAPVVAEATSDPAAARLAARIRTLGEGTVPPSGTTCGSLDTGRNQDYLVDRAGDQDVLDGVWRLHVDPDAMVAAGAPRSDAMANAGTWTITVKGHVARVRPPRGPDCDWDFYFGGDQVAIDFSYGGNDACWGLAHGRFERRGDVVHFRFDRERYFDVVIDNAMFADGMRKVG